MKKFVPFRDRSFTTIFVGLHPTLFNLSASRTNKVTGYPTPLNSSISRVRGRVDS